MNELGQGESIDLKQARHYYERSCNNGLKKGCERLKSYYTNRYYIFII
ncbi:MAG: hypothetical protein ACLRP3_01730 [Escherichia sp.]